MCMTGLTPWLAQIRTCQASRIDHESSSASLSAILLMKKTGIWRIIGGIY